MVHYSSRSKGFSLIEILIVITVIGILSSMLLSSMGGMAGRQARDADRISDIQQLATVVKSKQNQFHTPPLSGSEGRYPSDCKTGSLEDLPKCLETLKVADSKDDLMKMVKDPKQGDPVGDNTDTLHEYFYWADNNSFKICAFLEDQGAFDKLNATKDGVALTENYSPSEDELLMYCHFDGPTARSSQESVVAFDFTE